MMKHNRLGTIVCWHRHYALGDEQPAESPEKWLTNLALQACPHLKATIEYWENRGLELLLERHVNNVQAAVNAARRKIDSYINTVLDLHYVIFTLSFGFIYVPIEQVVQVYGDDSLESIERAKECLRAEVAAYRTLVSLN